MTTQKKTPSRNKLFLCTAALTLLTLANATAQSQLGGVPLWTNVYQSGSSALAVAVDGSGNVFVTGKGFATLKYSSAGVPLWTNRYTGPNDVAVALAVDGSGNVVVTGYPFGSDPDYVTIKYSATGIPLWTNRYNGPVDLGGDTPKAVAVDGNGDVFVTGTSADLGDFNNSAYATIKYSATGIPLWTNRYNGSVNYNEANALAVDSRGNVFVTGRSLNGNYSYATIKYSGEGVPLWTNRYNLPGGNASSAALSLAVDHGDNAIVAGYSVESGGYPDYVTLKYSAAVAPMWTNRYNGPASNVDYAFAVAVDGSGNVFVTGSSLVASGQKGYATIAYSGAGLPLWTNLYDGDTATAVAVDKSGNVFVTGYAGSPYDYATVAYSGAGVPLWTNRYNGPANNNDLANAIAVDNGGNVFVTGSARFSVIFGYSTIKYSSAIPPSLTIVGTTTNTVVISWPSPSIGFTLQQNTNALTTVNWSNVIGTPSDDGTTKAVIVDPPTGNRFYRLVHQ